MVAHLWGAGGLVSEDFLELGSGARRRSLGVRAQAELVEDCGIVRRPALRKQVGHFVNLGLVGQADTTVLLVPKRDDARAVGRGYPRKVHPHGSHLMAT